MKKNSSLTKYLKSRLFGKEPKNLCYSQNGNEEIITVTKTISATRKVLPPRYITNGSVYLIGRHAAVQLKEYCSICMVTEQLDKLANGSGVGRTKLQ